MFNFLRTSGFRCGLIGAAVVLVGGKLVKTKAAHKAAVNVAAWGMQAKNDIAESLRNIRDEASDICAEAAEQNNADDNSEQINDGDTEG